MSDIMKDMLKAVAFVIVFLMLGAPITMLFIRYLIFLEGYLL